MKLHATFQQRLQRFGEITETFNKSSKTDKSTAAKTNVKHRIFTGDHAQSTNEPTESPTERRIIHEEVQKMLDEGIVQPSESPWSSPVVLVLDCLFRGEQCRTHKSRYQVPIAELAERWTELPQELWVRIPAPADLSKDWNFVDTGAKNPFNFVLNDLF
ncbi:retrovirus-related Pol polyprotein from transposon 297 [Trichonephila clavipes]|uniref:Retrovirus-related Pol polyprotein from transposon 297 n=1 Tax=Trichonephila clavipes TaxID=2585209 RepID=A0A8X6VMR2_TRICX|nr:retrovirus-related Pol polyprotein from transposon 297 [Trichonephila clavipes]